MMKLIIGEVCLAAAELWRSAILCVLNVFFFPDAAKHSDGKHMYRFLF